MSACLIVCMCVFWADVSLVLYLPIRTRCVCVCGDYGLLRQKRENKLGTYIYLVFLHNAIACAICECACK